MAFLGRTCLRAQQYYKTYENEAYLNGQTLHSTDYLFWGLPPVHAFIDQKNALYSIIKLAFHPNSPHHVLLIARRWLNLLTCFEFIYIYIDSAEYFFCEIFTQRCKGQSSASTEIVATLCTDIAFSGDEMDSLPVEEIIDKQQKNQHPAYILNVSEGLYESIQNSWTPD